MQPILPSPDPDLCPRCGANVGHINSPYCPSCGALVKPTPKSTSVIKIIIAVLLGLAALGSAGVGACLLILGGLGAGGGGELMAVAAGCLLAALLMFAGMIALVVKR